LIDDFLCLYFNLAGLGFGFLGQVDRQDAVIRIRGDLFGVDYTGHADSAVERTTAAFTDVIFAFFFVDGFIRNFAANAEGVVVIGNFNFLWVKTGNAGFDRVFLIGLEDIKREARG